MKVACKAEVFETKACGKRQVGKGAHSIYSGCSCSRSVVYIIYCPIVVGKYPFLSLHQANLPNSPEEILWTFHIKSKRIYIISSEKSDRYDMSYPCLFGEYDISYLSQLSCLAAMPNLPNYPDLPGKPSEIKTKNHYY